MRIIKVIADKKPMFCCECPLNVTAVKVDKTECGENKTILDGGAGWKVGGKVPDSRCLITTEEEEKKQKERGGNIAGINIR